TRRAGRPPSRRCVGGRAAAAGDDRSLRTAIVSRDGAHPGVDVLRQLRLDPPRRSTVAPRPRAARGRHRATRLRVGARVLRSPQSGKHAARSSVVRGYQDLSGGTPDEAGPDEHGDVDREPCTVSRPQAGRVRRAVARRVEAVRPDDQAHPARVDEGRPARLHSEASENGVSGAVRRLGARRVECRCRRDPARPAHPRARRHRSRRRRDAAPAACRWRHQWRRSHLEPPQPRALVPNVHRPARRADPPRTIRRSPPAARHHERRTMRVSVFGLGYVGCVSAAAFAGDGHTVVGVDVNPDKVAAVNAGRSPVVEPGLDELLARATAEGRLRATTETADAIHDTEASLLCVGTPSQRNGSLDLTYLQRVCEQIGRELASASTCHVLAVRSTVLPGATHEVVIPTLERESGKPYGDGFGVSVNPEFLREGTARKDFRKPPLTLVGHNHAADASGTIALYQAIDAPLITTSIRVAEMMKYTSNTWHALKVCFANEIGNLCKRLDIDSHEVMDIFCRDEKLNLSSYYLKPGFAFGGSCLPKDVRALQHGARQVDLEMPMFWQILPSNRRQIELAVEQVLETGKKQVGLLGFSFKAGTDDLRESPLVILAETLLAN